MGILNWAIPRRFERVGFELYNQAVAYARDPFLFDTLGVPDTLDGRFDAIGIFAFLVIDRLQREDQADLAQAVFDAMFADMDVNLRELGVSDLSVGKRVKAMWEAFHGRCQRYATALADQDQAALAAALAHNVWRGAPAPGAVALAGIMLRQAANLADCDIAALRRGNVGFLPNQAVVA